MDQGYVELAKLFKIRDNKNRIGNIYGTIINTTPLEIKLNEDIILKSKHLIITKTISDMITSLVLISGDSVMLSPMENEQVFFVVDKVVL